MTHSETEIQNTAEESLGAIALLDFACPPVRVSPFMPVPEPLMPPLGDLRLSVGLVGMLLLVGRRLLELLLAERRLYTWSLRDECGGPSPAGETGRSLSELSNPPKDA